MSDPLFFGYGSLVNLATHAYRDPRPACLPGWRRVWRGTSLRELAFLSVEPAPDCEIEGVVASVPGADWAALDAREAAYTRIDVSETIRHAGPAAPCAVYRVSERFSATGAAPILLSYLDTVAGGFLAHYGEAGLERFFATTAGWGPVRDDRAQPIYSRAVALDDEERALIDALLRDVAVDPVGDPAGDQLGMSPDRPST